VDARERIWRARQAENRTADLEALAESEPVREQPSPPTQLEKSLSANLAWVRREVQSLQEHQKENLSRLRGEVAFIASALARAEHHQQKNRWITPIVCVLIALAAGVTGGAISPRISAESQRLQRLGTAVEAGWLAMTPAERKQLEKLLGWSRPTERAAR
jgi:hypothetical protein